MEGKRYFLKLELEQLPEKIWPQFQTTEIVRKLGFQEKSVILRQIATLPESQVDELKQTLQKIRDEDTFRLLKIHPEKLGMFLLSTLAISEEDARISAWEDEASKDL